MTEARPIRVMTVDDSLIVRQLISDSLRAVPGIELVGTASNGRIALEKMHELRPDIVTLDVEMPELDGIATLRRIRAEHSGVRVIMFSSLTKRAAATTLEALSAGASDYVAKPEGTGGMTATREHIRAELVPRIRALCVRAKPTSVALARRSHSASPTVLAIGASTGGPAALEQLLGALPSPLPIPVLIVQHVPPVFSKMLAERLSASTGHDVREATIERPLSAGRVWLAPGDRHLVAIRRNMQLGISLDDGPPRESCRPSVDVLFESVAEVFGNGAIGVVLTGMGQDGLKGATAIHAAGGRIAAQDEASSVVWGMPGAIARAGLADAVLPLPALANELRTWMALSEARAQV